MFLVLKIQSQDLLNSLCSLLWSCQQDPLLNCSDSLGVHIGRNSQYALVARTDLSCSVSGRSLGLVTRSLGEGTWVCETLEALFFWIKAVCLLRLRLT